MESEVKVSRKAPGGGKHKCFPNMRLTEGGTESPGKSRNSDPSHQNGCERRGGREGKSLWRLELSSWQGFTVWGRETSKGLTWEEGC